MHRQNIRWSIRGAIKMMRPANGGKHRTAPMTIRPLLCQRFNDSSQRNGGRIGAQRCWAGCVAAIHDSRTSANHSIHRNANANWIAFRFPCTKIVLHRQRLLAAVRHIRLVLFARARSTYSHLSMYCRHLGVEVLADRHEHCNFAYEPTSRLGCRYFLLFVFHWNQLQMDSSDNGSVLRPKVGDIFLVIFGATCQQGTSVMPRSATSRIIMIVAFIILMFLYTSYSANIVALLQSPSTRIKTLKDLYESRLEIGVDDTVFNRYYFTVNFQSNELEHRFAHCAQFSFEPSSMRSNRSGRRSTWRRCWRKMAKTISCHSKMEWNVFERYMCRCDRYKWPLKLPFDWNRDCLRFTWNSHWATRSWAKPFSKTKNAESERSPTCKWRSHGIPFERTLHTRKCSKLGKFSSLHLLLVTHRTHDFHLQHVPNAWARTPRSRKCAHVHEETAMFWIGRQLHYGQSYRYKTSVASTGVGRHSSHWHACCGAARESIHTEEITEVTSRLASILNSWNLFVNNIYIAYTYRFDLMRRSRIK